MHGQVQAAVALELHGHVVQVAHGAVAGGGRVHALDQVGGAHVGLHLQGEGQIGQVAGHRFPHVLAQRLCALDRKRAPRRQPHVAEEVGARVAHPDHLHVAHATHTPDGARQLPLDLLW